MQGRGLRRADATDASIMSADWRYGDRTCRLALHQGCIRFLGGRRKSRFCVCSRLFGNVREAAPACCSMMYVCLALDVLLMPHAGLPLAASQLSRACTRIRLDLASSKKITETVE
ncbi:hypothetical protein M440DRAFT_1021362 [Trichoderma longibrachiatum ATCC 18648]|uniref:Uncharacterized protein n=1 Tax=Trichoderma longibrachiatum ATCC 18648 TaxID=983965 RepID=A0A2T4CJJ0_TRILO|nr:hypothetical protein M440DRAFT_1021362 [Trichoderma longibrachiatum ATCC 18648]